MLPIHKLAAKILGLGTAFGLSLFLALWLGWWPLFFVAIVILPYLGDMVFMFKFTWENTMREFDD